MSEALLLGLDEAARMLALSRRTVQELVYAGELRSVRIGRSRRIAVVDLEAFVRRLQNENDREAWQPAVIGGGDEHRRTQP